MCLGRSYHILVSFPVFLQNRNTVEIAILLSWQYVKSNGFDLLPRVIIFVTQYAT